MSELFKKRNDGPTEPLTPEVITPPPIPPYRTWVVTSGDSWDLDEPKTRIISNCHDVEIGSTGIAVFSTIFFHHATNALKIAPRYALAAGTWTEIEEVNAEFNEPVSN